jgi:uncharacterized RDD family membrane protein YckC
MTQPSGWYDDPQDTSQLRYWDGVAWTSNLTPKAATTVGQFVLPNAVAPDVAHPEVSGSYGAPGLPSAPGSFGSSQQGYGQPSAYGQQGGQPPVYGQSPGYPAPQQSGAGWQSSPVPSTPDGVPLSGWWKRVLARLLDGLIISIVSLPLTLVPLKGVFEVWRDYFQASLDAAKPGSAASTQAAAQLNAQFTIDLASKMAVVSLITLAVFLIYEIAFLTMTGATIGKKAVGISVRLRDEPGPPPLLAVIKRTAVVQVGSVFQQVPVIGSLLSVFSLLDALWPLWDSKKQALHDKVAATNVVVGPQPKRGA